ncbi:uncharacterized protein LKV04_011971 isoform 1-T1 [Tautogolabrus adspersus]
MYKLSLWDQTIQRLSSRCVAPSPGPHLSDCSAHWTKASIQVNQQLAGHPEARISQSLPELQERRLDLQRNRITCSRSKSSFKARCSRPRELQSQLAVMESALKLEVLILRIDVKNLLTGQKLKRQRTSPQ